MRIRYAVAAAVTVLGLTAAATPAVAAATTAAVTKAQAVKIAKKKVPGAYVSEVEREYEHGRRTWKIELEKGHWEYDVYVAVSDGSIVKFTRDYDD
ncbi:PepSY domain-containing protein [Herbidospora yilanensis]|uniref:PepSY domain-containing protein n=1 Tax=Herbidospora yilanensis TaxID=354426 RepID=UPI000780C3A0|nr:PepSY domain-containing protein [Herbidospora yilanensis]